MNNAMANRGEFCVGGEVAQFGEDQFDAARVSGGGNPPRADGQISAGLDLEFGVGLPDAIDRPGEDAVEVGALFLKNGELEARGAGVHHQHAFFRSRRRIGFPGFSGDGFHLGPVAGFSPLACGPLPEAILRSGVSSDTIAPLPEKKSFRVLKWRKVKQTDDVPGWTASIAFCYRATRIEAR